MILIAPAIGTSIGDGGESRILSMMMVRWLLLLLMMKTIIVCLDRIIVIINRLFRSIIVRTGLIRWPALLLIIARSIAPTRDRRVITLVSIDVIAILMQESIGDDIVVVVVIDVIVVVVVPIGIGWRFASYQKSDILLAAVKQLARLLQRQVLGVGVVDLQRSSGGKEKGHD